MAISASDIGKIIAGHDDLGHELAVGRLLRSHTASQTEQRASYRDPESKKLREFDYRWTFRSSSTVVSCAIECKNIYHDAPLVVYGRKRAGTEAFHYLIESRRGLFHLPGGKDKGLIDTPCSHVIRRVQGEDSIYAPNEFVGDAVIRIKTKGPADRSQKTTYVRSTDAEVYALWTQAVASATGLAECARKYCRDLNLSNVFTVVFPLVVVPDGSLWKAERATDGQILGEPVKVDTCEFFIGREISVDGDVTDIGRKYVFSHVHFFTTTGLEAFLRNVTADEPWTKRLFNEDVIRIAQSERV